LLNKNNWVKISEKITGSSENYFIGNPNQDGIDSILEKLYLRKTLMFVKSKSGSTSEPRNAMKEVEHDFYKKESN
jgi:glucose-6-phosphate isomerase